MILILLSWIIILFCFTTSGVVLQRILKLNQTHFSTTIFLGIFVQCVLLSILSLVIKIGVEVFIGNLITSIGLFYWQRNQIANMYIEFKHDFKTLHKSSKIILLGVFILTLYKSAQLPFLIDNESYYVQTIKWINEYGLVKGLANLHVFFGQTSPFHILQAGFNFSFITDRINDINGFIVLISSFFYCLVFEKKYKESKQIHWIGFVLVFNVIFFQFISAPSPDLILFVLTQIICFYFLEEESTGQNSEENFKRITILTLLLIFIKITILPLGLVLVYWVIKHKKGYVFMFVSSCLIALIFIVKNIIISGYPLYPLNILPIQVDWKIPERLIEFISLSKDEGYFENSAPTSLSYYHKIYAWLRLDGMNRLFNWGILLLFFLAVFTKKIQQNSSYKILYSVFLIHFVIIFLLSPQFRFFLPEFIFLSVLIISDYSERLQLSIKVIRIGLILVAIVPILIIECLDFKNLTTNKLHQKKSGFSLVQLYMPEKNSRFSDIVFEKVKNGNLEYYSPKDNFFFWGTGNGSLPCVNRQQINYFEKYYTIKPQLRTTTIKDGFYSKIAKSNHSNSTTIGQ